MSISGLNALHKKYHFINENSCPTCITAVENNEHFFLSCVAHAAQWHEVLMAQIRQTLPSKSNVIDCWEIIWNRKKVLELITLGREHYDVDIELLGHVAKYIANSHWYERNDN